MLLLSCEHHGRFCCQASPGVPRRASTRSSLIGTYSGRGQWLIVFQISCPLAHFCSYRYSCMECLCFPHRVLSCLPTPPNSFYSPPPTFPASGRPKASCCPAPPTALGRWTTMDHLLSFPASSPGHPQEDGLICRFHPGGCFWFWLHLQHVEVPWRTLVSPLF